MAECWAKAERDAPLVAFERQRCYPCGVESVGTASAGLLHAEAMRSLLSECMYILQDRTTPTGRLRCQSTPTHTTRPSR